jgi:tol-pal system protein YbgF
MVISLVLFPGLIQAQDEALPEIEEVQWTTPPSSTEPAAAAPSGAAQLWLNANQRIEQLQQEMDELRGQVEEQAHALRQGLAPGATPASATHQPVAAPSNATTPEQAYQVAYQAIQQRDYVQGQALMQGFIEQYPDHAYQANAHYWLGEVYLTQGKLALAQSAFQTVIQEFANHPKAADALLKLGFIAYQQQDWSQAKKLLQKVSETYPQTTTAHLAQARLQKMANEGHQ